MFLSFSKTFQDTSPTSIFLCTKIDIQRCYFLTLLVNSAGDKIPFSHGYIVVAEAFQQWWVVRHVSVTQLASEVWEIGFSFCVHLYKIRWPYSSGGLCICTVFNVWLYSTNVVNFLDLSVAGHQSETTHNEGMFWEDCDVSQRMRSVVQEPSDRSTSAKMHEEIEGAGACFSSFLLDLRLLA